MKDEFDRKWKTKLEFSWWDGVYITMQRYLIQLEGKPCNVPVSGHYVRFVIRDWKIEEWHGWYDGGNCTWQFGPFVFGMHGVIDCKKCRNSDEN